MYRNSKSNGGKLGSALVYGLVIMTIVSILLTSIITFVTSHLRYSFQVHSKEQSFQAAESGIYFYRWYLAHSTEGKTSQEIEDFWNGSPRPLGVVNTYEGVYTDSAGETVGRYELSVEPPESGSTDFTVTSRGWTDKYPDLVRTVRVRFRRPAWSDYVLLGNVPQRIPSGTNANGKVFANGGVRFDGVAHNTVSSAVSTGVWTSWSGEYNTAMASDVFLAGKSFPEPTIDFNNVTADLNYIKTEAQNGGTVDGCGASSCYFSNTHQGWHIVLNTNGTFEARRVKNYSSPGVGNVGNSTGEITSYQGGWSVHTIPDNGVIFVENNVWIEGTINGRHVTVVSANLISSNTYNVYIQKDIRYTNYDGSDILGIISQNDIEITKNSNDILRIDGALLAQNGRVGRSAYGNSKNSITVFGAIATNQRYGFASEDGTGYASSTLTYDSNFLYVAPPYFPTGTQYLIDLWEEL
jgi:hypothetical protein